MSLRRLLNNQSGQFWGGFLGGLNQSMKEGRERSDKHRELELRKKQIDAQIKGMDADNEIKQHTLKQKMAELGSREELAKSFEGTPDNYQSQEFSNPENVTSLRDQMLPSKSTPGTPGDPRRAAMVRAGLGREAVAPQPKSLMEQYQEMQMFQQAVGGQGQGGQQPQPQGAGAPAPAQQPPGVKFNSKGQGILSMPGEEKTPFRADDALYRSLMKKHNGNFEAARAEYDEKMRATNVARGEGTTQGGLNIRQKPDYLKNRTDMAEATTAGGAVPVGQAKEVASLDAAIRQIEIAEKNFSKDFIGPIAGRDITNTLQRQMGSWVGKPMTAQKSAFNTALDRAEESLIRAWEGAVVSDPMYQRLRGMLPDRKTEDPDVFRADMLRFKVEMQKALRTSEGLVNTPRGRANAPRQQNHSPLPAKLQQEGWE